jgi:hypothetical protein
MSAQPSAERKSDSGKENKGPVPAAPAPLSPGEQPAVLQVIGYNLPRDPLLQQAQVDQPVPVQLPVGQPAPVQLPVGQPAPVQLPLGLPVPVQLPVGVLPVQQPVGPLPQVPVEPQIPVMLPVGPLGPAVGIIVPDILPIATLVMIAAGTQFVMNGVPSVILDNLGNQPPVHGVGARIIWPVGTVIYVEGQVRRQNMLMAGHLRDTLPIGTTIILPHGTNVSYGGVRFTIPLFDTEAERTVQII